jgi:hypothetical protein
MKPYQRRHDGHDHSHLVDWRAQQTGPPRFVSVAPNVSRATCRSLSQVFPLSPGAMRIQTGRGGCKEGMGDVRIPGCWNIAPGAMNNCLLALDRCAHTSHTYRRTGRQLADGRGDYGLRVRPG